MKKCKEAWRGIKNEIKSTNGDKECEYGKYFMKIKFDSYHDLPLNKQLKFSAMTIIVRSVFEDNGQFCSQVYLDECLYEI